MEVNPMNESSAAVSSSPVHLSREQILQVTANCLRDYGYDATTIRKIAGQLGCAVGSIYRYFTDKRELLSIVTQQMLEPVAVMAQQGAQIEQSVRMYHQVASHMPETYRLMFWLVCPEMPTADTDATKLPEIVQQTIDCWAEKIGMASAQTVWALVHGFILMGRDADAMLAVVQPIWKSAERSKTIPVSKANRPTMDESSEESSVAEPSIVILAKEPMMPSSDRATAGHRPVAITSDTVPAGQADDVCLL